MNIKNLLLGSIIFFSATASVAEVDEKYVLGEKAHAEHCYKCHDDHIYTRENSFVKSLDALSKQVVRCKNNIGIPWFDEDTETVIHFVNKKFYKF